MMPSPVGTCSRCGGTIFKNCTGQVGPHHCPPKKELPPPSPPAEPSPEYLEKARAIADSCGGATVAMIEAFALALMESEKEREAIEAWAKERIALALQSSESARASAEAEAKRWKTTHGWADAIDTMERNEQRMVARIAELEASVAEITRQREEAREQSREWLKDANTQARRVRELEAESSSLAQKAQETERTLKAIRTAYAGECGCDDHSGENCCNQAGEPCAFCLSSRALPSAPATKDATVDFLKEVFDPDAKPCGVYVASEVAVDTCRHCGWAASDHPSAPATPESVNNRLTDMDRLKEALAREGEETDVTTEAGEGDTSKDGCIGRVHTRECIEGMFLPATTEPKEEPGR